MDLNTHHIDEIMNSNIVIGSASYFDDTGARSKRFVYSPVKDCFLVLIDGVEMNSLDGRDARDTDLPDVFEDILADYNAY